jgi:hypothetical protein
VVNDAHNPPSPRYVALLSAAAMLVLVLGWLLRPATKQASVVPTNELASLPERSQRRELRDMAQYIRQRAEAFAASVVYLSSSGVSGLVLGHDSVLSAFVAGPHHGSAADVSASPEFVLLPSEPGDSALPAARDTSSAVGQTRWGIVVARAPDGQQLAVSGMTSGTVDFQCGGFALRELVFDAPLPASFTGGGVFDLDGNVVGLAVPCGGRIALVPLQDVLNALERQHTPEHQLWTHHGFRVAPLDSITRSVLRAKGDLVVSEVRVGSTADQAGLRPGHVITSSAAQAVAERTASLPAAGGRQLTIRRLPDGRLDLTTRPARAGIREAPLPSSPASRPSVTLEQVNSRAASAGLRVGDRVLQISLTYQPSAAVVRRALADTTPVYVVYERQGHRRGVLLR